MDGEQRVWAIGILCATVAIVVFLYIIGGNWNDANARNTQVKSAWNTKCSSEMSMQECHLVDEMIESCEEMMDEDKEPACMQEVYDRVEKADAASSQG